MILDSGLGSSVIFEITKRTLTLMDGYCAVKIDNLIIPIIFNLRYLQNLDKCRRAGPVRSDFEILHENFINKQRNLVNQLFFTFISFFQDDSSDLKGLFTAQKNTKISVSTTITIFYSLTYILGL